MRHGLVALGLLALLASTVQAGEPAADVNEVKVTLKGLA
jgi:hypothetical protein